MSGSNPTPSDMLLGPTPTWGLEEDASREAVARRLFGREQTRKIGRFELGERLGLGGMGEVWAAFDPKLERSVALKTVRASMFTAATERQRLIDEARALARLRHENVLCVHDVLDVDDLVVIVMERVEGEVLRVWARREEVDRQRLMVALEAAGRGLIAAHAAGVIHLDVKPDNILVGRDGRVLVADFGLASTLDRPRVIVGGTPGFAAPEQWSTEGSVPDERADQFAFASTVCCLLGGSPTFAADDPSQLDHEQFRARACAAVERTGLGRGQQKALLQALARAPADRWESMSALAYALFIRPRLRSRRAALIGAGVLAIGLGGAAVRGIHEPAICAGVTAEQWLTRAWDPAQRAAFLQAATSAPDMERSAIVATERLDERRRELALEWPRVCEADLLRGEDQPATAARRCVERKRRELVAVSRMLGDPTPIMLERALQIVEDLGSVDDCILVVRSGAPVLARSAEQLEQSDRVHARLAEAKAHRHAGDRDAQRSDLAEAAELAAALDEPSLLAEVDQRLGHMAVEDGEIEAGLAQVEEAYFTAAKAGDELLAADTASLLVFLASRAGDVERGQRWALHAEAHFSKLDADDIRWARLSTHRGALADAAGDPEQSLAHYRRAVDSLRSSGVDTPGLLLVALNGVAIGLEITGDLAEALATYAKIEPILRAEYGDRHPDYGVLANNIGAAHQAVGELEVAIEWHERARAIAVSRGLERLRLSALINLCFAHGSARHGERGLHRCRAAVELCREIYEGATQRCSSAYMGLGNHLAATGAGEDALAAYREVFEAYAANYQADDPNMAWAWSSLGAGHVAVQAWADAREAYEQAGELAAKGAFPRTEVAEIEFGLAKAWLGLGEPERARELASSAATAYRETGHSIAQREVGEWLAANLDAGER